MRYLQLTHNEWDPATKTSRPKVLHSFGREDQLDRDAIKRLVASLTRLLDPATALTGTTTAGSERAGVHLVPPGRRHAGAGRAVAPAGDRHRHDPAADRPQARPAHASGCCSRWSRTGRWRRARSWPPPAGSTATCAHRRPGRDLRRRLLPGDGLAARHRARIWSGRCSGRSPPCSTTRSTCCSSTPPPPTSRPTTPTSRSPATTTAARSPTADRRTEAAAGPGQDGGFRTYGKSKDSRDDLPQVVIGMAVTRAGIPVRVWCWPGQHHRLRADPPGPRGHAGLDAGPGRCGSPTAGSPPPRTAGTCAAAAGTTSSARSSARAPRRPPPRCPGRAATSMFGTTCRSRKSTSPTTSGS